MATEMCEVGVVSSVMAGVCLGLILLIRVNVLVANMYVSQYKARLYGNTVQCSSVAVGDPETFSISL